MLSSVSQFLFSCIITDLLDPHIMLLKKSICQPSCSIPWNGTNGQQRNRHCTQHKYNENGNVFLTATVHCTCTFGNGVMEFDNPVQNLMHANAYMYIMHASNMPVA